MSGLEEKIVLEQGDLIQAEVEAIVNAANNDLQLGGGVAGAIRRQGGPAIQEECDRLRPIQVGGAAITTGGKLKAKYVVHAASMRLGGRTTAEPLRSSTRRSLELAKEKGVRSIAFPAVGTGIAGFPMRDCAQIMLEEVVKHLEGEITLQQVRFVLYDQKALDAFQQVWDGMRKKGV